MRSSETVKIVHVTTVHRPDDVRIYRKEVLALARAGYEVVLVAPERRGSHLDVKQIAIPDYPSRARRMVFAPIRACIAALRERPDACHIHDPELLLAAMAMKLLGHAAIIYDVHENFSASLLARDWLPRFLRRFTAGLFRLIESILARTCDLVVAATEDIERLFPRCRTVLVRNYPICRRPTGDRARKGSASPKTAIYVGGLTRSDGIEQLLTAAGLLQASSPVRLVLAGEFSDSAFRTQLADKGLLGSGEFLGWISAKEIQEQLSAADVGVVCPLPDPNNIHALPNKLFEYMCNGLPVVASDFGAIGEIVGRYKCGILVDPVQPQSIAEGIRRVTEHPEEASSMGEAGRSAVLAHLNWDSESKVLLKAYREIVGSASGA